MSSRIKDDQFGTMPSGEGVQRFTLSSDALEVEILSYGGIVRALRVPDTSGELRDVVLGFDTLEPYLGNPPYFGAIIGRYANRIARGRFALNGRAYQLPINNRPNSLHGGNRGFDKRLWQAEQKDAGVELSYPSPNGEEGYPGDLQVRVTYSIEGRALRIRYEAETDQPTVLNLTNHSYFNLGGSHTILQHRLRLAASRFTPVDTTQIPTGELVQVAGTPFDFRELTEIGRRISDPSEQLRIGKGYDHNWVLNHGPAEFAVAAVLSDPESGSTLEVHTDQPGIQFYSGNLLDGLRGKQGRTYGAHSGLCLETQHFPDSPNHPEFPSTTLMPGDSFKSRTEFRFSLEGEMAR